MDNIFQVIEHVDDFSDEIETSQLPSQLSQAAAADKQTYDFVLKFLLVGDSDVGKEEILHQLEDDEDDNSETYRSPDVAYKSTSILLYGKRLKLHMWNTSGQGRFSTVFHSYSRGAQGIILVYDITNKWSFNSLDRWLQEIDKHAPGVPKILVGNRKHLAFRRQISEKQAKNYANKHNMAFLEVSPLCNFNVKESCAELSRLVLERNGIRDFWTNSSMSSLQELCYQRIISQVNAYEIENLPLPPQMKSYLKSFSSTVQSNYIFQNQVAVLKKRKSKRRWFSFKSSKSFLNCNKPENRFFSRIFSFNLFHKNSSQTLYSKTRHSCTLV